MPNKIEMKVSFSTIDPNDFGGPILSTIKRKKKKKRTVEEGIAIRLKAIEGAKASIAREEYLRNRLLEVLCGNPNCENTLEYVYDNKKSEYWAKVDAHWVHFKSTKCWLCSTCAEIQVIRNFYYYDGARYHKAKNEYMNRMFPRDDTLA